VKLHLSDDYNVDVKAKQLFVNIMKSKHFYTTKVPQKKNNVKKQNNCKQFFSEHITLACD